MRWRKVTLLGVGLLGGSLGLALKRRNLVQAVSGYVRRPSSVQECLSVGAVDSATLDAREAVAGADLVVFCTPLAQMPLLAREIRPALKEGAIATDVGSAKESISRELSSLLKPAGVEFIGSHPMAGSEKMGVTAARADLFEGAVCVVTPTEASPGAIINEVEGLWSAVGGRVLRLPPGLHDELVSRSSHLPHVLAAALASSVLDPARPADQTKLCANGFRDTTRIASGSPEMWRDISLANGQHLSRSLDEFIARLKEFRSLLDREDSSGIEEFFRVAKTRRDAWTSQCASPSPE